MLIPPSDNALIINAAIIRFKIVTFMGPLLIYEHIVILLRQLLDMQLSRHFLSFGHARLSSYTAIADFYDPSALRS